MNNKKYIRKIALNTSIISGVLLSSIVISKTSVTTINEILDISGLVGCQVISDYILIKTKENKQKN